MPPKQRFDEQAEGGSDDSFESEDEGVKGKKGKDKQVRRRSSKACTYLVPLSLQAESHDSGGC